jgi:hypothetical protein
MVRTYLLENIAIGIERRYNVDSSVTSCLMAFATSFAAHHGQKDVTCFAERRKKRARRLLPGPLTLQTNRMKPAVRPMYSERAVITQPPAFQAGCRGFEPRLPLLPLQFAPLKALLRLIPRRTL